MWEHYKRYGPLLVFLILSFIGFYMIRSYLISLISSALITYIFYPLYRKINSKLRQDNLSALIMCILILFGIIMPVAFMTAEIVKEIPTLYNLIFEITQNSKVWNDMIVKKLKEDFGIHIDISSIVRQISIMIFTRIQSFILSIPTKIINFSVAAFFLFFFFRDGNRIMNKIVNYLPFARKDSLIILRQTKDMIDGVVYGAFVTALVQAGISTIGYVILGVKAPLFWGFVTFISSIIPYIGPFVVYIPLGFAMIISGSRAGDTLLITKGIILIIYGLGIVSSIDNFIRPFLIGGKVSMHPLLIFLGLLGGLTTFGFIGIILGPIIVALLVTLLNIYEMREDITQNIARKR